MRIIGIPARYGSTRFPGKPIYPIKGKPLIVWVIERATKSRLANDIFVATDDERIYEVVEKTGIKVFMTPKEIPSGTDRLAFVAKNYVDKWEFIVNLQGDEPLVNPDDIDRIFEELETCNTVVTLRKRIEEAGEIENPNVVKVISDKKGFAIYFSRSVIPYFRNKKPTYYKHIGIYGYPIKTLIELTSLPQGELELAESLEQLRALENGIPIRVLDTNWETIGVDTPEDIVKVEKMLEESR